MYAVMIDDVKVGREQKRLTPEFVYVKQQHSWGLSIPTVVICVAFDKALVTVGSDVYL